MARGCKEDTKQESKKEPRYTDEKEKQRAGDREKRKTSSIGRDTEKSKHR
jgi:hypothetical protein